MPIDPGAAVASGNPSDIDLLRRLLDELGLSQREAARQLGLDDRSMRYYCSGKLPVPPGIFLALQELTHIQQNDQCLAMLEDGTMSTSDGQLSAERFRKANQARRAALEKYVSGLRTPHDLDALPVPDVLEDAYADVDAGEGQIDELAIGERLRHMVANIGRELEGGERRGVFALIDGLRFASRRTYGRPVWEMHWQPMSGGTDKAGVVHHFPDVADADDATVREWSRRARGSQHPILRARYADLAWEVAKYRIKTIGKNAQAPRPIRPNADDARRAIDAYLGAVAGDLAVDEFRAWHYLARAVELAATIRDAGRVQRLKAMLFQYRSARVSAGTHIFWLFDDIVWEQQDALALTPTEREIAMTALKETLEIRRDPANPALFDPYQAQDAADRLGRWQRHTGDEIGAQEAASRAGGAFEAAAAQATGFTSISLLERQAVRYREAGDVAGAARVEQAIRKHAVEAENELKRVTVPYDISREALDSWSDQVAGTTPEEGLQLLAGAGLLRRDRAEKNVTELAKTAIFQARVPLMVMGRDGFASAHIGSVEEDLDGRAVHHAATMLGNLAPFLNVAFARFREKHGVDVEKFIGLLGESPLFPPARLNFVRDGIAAWFAEDWVKTVLVLVPQIEGAMRDLLAALGGPVMKRNHQYGGFQAIGLGEVLSHDILRRELPEDIRFHLRVLLQDPRGINLRGESAHGLAAYELFSRGIGNWVIHAVIMVGLIRLRRTENPCRSCEQKNTTHGAKLSGSTPG